jgi:hypothetical protein
LQAEACHDDGFAWIRSNRAAECKWFAGRGPLRPGRFLQSVALRWRQLAGDGLGRLSGSTLRRAIESLAAIDVVIDLDDLATVAAHSVDRMDRVPSATTKRLSMTGAMFPRSSMASGIGHPLSEHKCGWWQVGNMVTGTTTNLQVASLVVPESPEHCLKEAEECDRLASLSETTATRQILQSVAFHWRKLAERTAEPWSARASLPADGTMTACKYSSSKTRRCWPKRCATCC